MRGSGKRLFLKEKLQPVVVFSSMCYNKFAIVRKAPVAQLDRVADFESVGRGFESLRARHLQLACGCTGKSSKASSDNLIAIFFKHLRT